MSHETDPKILLVEANAYRLTFEENHVQVAYFKEDTDVISNLNDVMNEHNLRIGIIHVNLPSWEKPVLEAHANDKRIIAIGRDPQNGLTDTLLETYKKLEKENVLVIPKFLYLSDFKDELTKMSYPGKSLNMIHVMNWIVQCADMNLWPLPNTPKFYTNYTGPRVEFTSVF